MRLKIEEYLINITEDVINCEIVEESFEVKLNGDVVINNIPSFLTENLIGTIDNSNTTFTTSLEYLGNSTMVYLNGLKLVRGVDYLEITPSTIEMTDPPSNIRFTDILEISYIRKNNG